MVGTLLVVEDEAHIRQFIAVNLAVRGYTCLQAESAEEGLEQLRGHNPAGLLLDIKLPGMSGWDMLKTIHADRDLPNLPVIVITASLTLDRTDEPTYPNILDKLIKPISAVELISAVQKIFR